MPFIKSHSNYVLKSRHQDINDGTIFERDITTIGAVNQFSQGQTPIYRSNNFIITVRNDGRPSNQYNSSNWKGNDSGDTWTLNTLSTMVSDFEKDNDTKIVLKQDYYDFRDFAYYGSLTELFRASVTDILAKFPGELYITSEHAYYTKAYSIDFQRIEESIPLGWYKEGSDTEPKYFLVSNPFDINLHGSVLPENANPLKYFAEDGYLNYQIGKHVTKKEGCSVIEDITWCDIINIEVSYHDPCSKKPDSCDCENMTIEPFDPNTCGCNNIEATMVVDDCNCNYIEATLVSNSNNGTLFRAATSNNENSNDETESSEEFYRRVAIIEITYKCEGEDEKTIVLYAYIADNNKIVYLVDDEELEGIHIRPKKQFLDKFFSELDNFQSLLVNRDTNYKSTFSVIRENENGYYREFVPFQFPIGDGGYNIDATEYGFNAYTTQMVEIGEYYDENFTDNLWRSMTHEAIKNFDWSYTREYVEGDEEEYVFGGQRIQKALRIFGREFDEIISYINNIKNINRVTYDERSNLPDYFLTDTVEAEGWDVKLVYPYELKEYYIDEGGNKVECVDSGDTKWSEGGESCDGQLNNRACNKDIRREFSQTSTKKVKPYTNWMIADGTENGYFIVCNKTDEDPCFNEDATVETIKNYCTYKNDETYKAVTSSCDKILQDNCALSGKGVLKNRIRPYIDEADWSFQEVNNEFLRRLKINSPYIWRHKGTIDGVEMILGMFGMKSKRWVEAHPEWVINCKYTDCNGTEEEGTECHEMWDYDIQEYTSFANRIEETWDVIHQDYRVNWINSTKTITYDNRFVSNYNTYGANENMLRYQGIPVAYREAYVSQEGDDSYLSYGEGDSKDYYIDSQNNKIIKRYLYPSFDKNEQLDGNPYFQMRGGWLSKTIVGETKQVGDKEDTPIWNFQFDVDDNIVFNKYLEKGYIENGFIHDNHPLFKETVRNIRRANNISDLLSIPTINLYNGIICYVTQIEKNSAIIDNVVYPIIKEWYSDKILLEGVEQTNGGVVSYVSLIKTNGFIKVGNNKFFDTKIIVYDIDGAESLYNIEEMPDGRELKAYIKDDGTFICKEDESGNYSISNFQILGSEDENGYTNYFMLDDINYADTLARFETEVTDDSSTEEPRKGWTSGWRRLSYGDKEYLQISSIINYYGGNNPHNGNMIYDNGHEYFTYFNRIFKYASDNDLFDERCYEDYYVTLDNEIVKYGFSGLIEQYEDILQYDDFLVPDTKIHYFGNYKTKKSINKQYLYCFEKTCYQTIQEAINKAKETHQDESDDSLLKYLTRKSNWQLDIAKSNGVPNIDDIKIYGDDTYQISGDSQHVGGYDVIYKPETEIVKGYNLSASTINGWIEWINPYNALTAKTDQVLDEESGEYKSVKRYPIIDDVTNQIVNNKIFDITFRLHMTFDKTSETPLPWYSRKVQEELKYIDDIVMNYLTQMIPSSTMLRIRYMMSDVIPTVVTSENKEENNG